MTSGELSNRIQSELNKLKRFLSNPKICISDYFDEIKNQIDLYYTNQIHCFQQSIVTEPDSNGNPLYEKLKGDYQLIIETVNLIENASLENIPDSKDIIGFEHDILNKIEAMLFNKSNDSVGFEDYLYKGLVRLRRHFMRSKSVLFIYISNTNWLGQLLVFQDVFIGNRGAQYLKNVLSGSTVTTQNAYKHCNECQKLDILINKLDNRHELSDYLIRILKSDLENDDNNEEHLDKGQPIIEFVFSDHYPYSDYSASETALIFSRNISEIDSETFNEFTNLEIIDLSYNLLKEIPKDVFHHLTRLMHLHLQFNSLMFLDPTIFDNLTNLNKLNISNNLITKVDPELFSGLKSLTIIDLSCNQIECIESGTFNNLPNLQQIDLSHNRISYIHKDNFNGSSNLKMIKLKFNSSDGFVAKFEPFIMMKFNFSIKIIA